ncbi:MAG: hypothetical protein GYB67_07460 [Chloroflexi bacterium]|nr:hypothetical protein [Chloroflexota bacterium]
MISFAKRKRTPTVPARLQIPLWAIVVIVVLIGARTIFYLSEERPTYAALDLSARATQTPGSLRWLYTDQTVRQHDGSLARYFIWRREAECLGCETLDHAVAHVDAALITRGWTTTERSCDNHYAESAVIYTTVTSGGRSLGYVQADDPALTACLLVWPSPITGGADPTYKIVLVTRNPSPLTRLLP